jgi:hypothetical protein
MSDYQSTQQPAPQQQYGAAPTPGQGTNVLAIIALVLGILLPPGGIVCGHIALRQIRRTHENGHGLALAGTIIGYVLTIGYILLFVGVLVFYAVLIGSIASTGGFSDSR